jgi:dolichol-phosphate mannosyltransferase
LHTICKSREHYNAALNFVKGVTGEARVLPPASHKVLVCVPTYNEAENIEAFIDAVFENAPPEAHILVVDDNSPDGTAHIVERIQEKYPERLYLLNRPGKQGGASAFLQSFEYGLKHNYNAMLAMDADFSHDPKYIPGILVKSNECDVVIGSRLVKGGGIENRSLLRNIISSGASLYCRLLLTAGIRDWTGGYNLWSKTALERIGIASIFTRGYSFQIEMKYKAFRSGLKIAEIPVIFPDRKRGASKMPFSYFVQALADVWRIKFSHIKNEMIKQMIKFAITGGLGTITNLALFFLCADLAKLPAVPVSIGCFLAAGTQNYCLHHKWSFAGNTRGTALSIKKWLQFLCSALFGLGVNIIVMNAILQSIAPPYKVIAQACGILAGMTINFIAAKIVVFRSTHID